MNEKGLSLCGETIARSLFGVCEEHGQSRTLRANQWQTDATRRRRMCAALKLEITGKAW